MSELMTILIPIGVAFLTLTVCWAALYAAGFRFLENKSGQDILKNNNHALDGTPDIWKRHPRLSLGLSIFLGLLIIACIAATVYIVNTGHGESFTEFYILGTDGKAENYPSDIQLGEEAEVILGIVNHEYAAMSYKVDISIDGTTVQNLVPLTLNAEEKWENIVSFKPVSAGSNQEVEFLLYKQESANPDLSLRLWINVTSR